MTALDRLDAAVKESDKLRALLIKETWNSGHDMALKRIEDFVVIKSKATPYSITSHELLEFIRINRCQKYQSQNSDAE